MDHVGTHISAQAVYARFGLITENRYIWLVTVRSRITRKYFDANAKNDSRNIDS